MNFDKENDRIFTLLADYLSYAPTFVTAEGVKSLVDEFDVEEKTAVALIAASAMGLDVVDVEEDKRLFSYYFPLMLKKMSVKTYREDEYFKRVKFIPAKQGDCEINFGRFAPYEMFVRDEPLMMEDGRVIPQIGYFDEEYVFPQILQGGREWMMINPDEVDTQKPYIERAHGKVLTFGLGLGYYAFQCLLKEDVSEVVVVEIDDNVIRLFEEKIRPYFPTNKPFKIVKADAFEYAANKMGEEKFDYVFTDIWHDPSDGIDLYLRMKECEKYAPEAEFGYWIEKTIKLYL